MRYSRGYRLEKLNDLLETYEIKDVDFGMPLPVNFRYRLLDECLSHVYIDTYIDFRYIDRDFIPDRILSSEVISPYPMAGTVSVLGDTVSYIDEEVNVVVFHSCIDKTPSICFPLIDRLNMTSDIMFDFLRV